MQVTFLRAGCPALRKKKKKAPIQSSMLITKEDGGKEETGNGGRKLLTLFEQLRHDVLVVVGCFDFFRDVRSRIFQVLCNANVSKSDLISCYGDVLLRRFLSRVRTSQVSVEVLQPPDLSHEPPPQRLLQVFPLTAALHQCLIGLRDTLDLLLQLKKDGKGKEKKKEEEEMGWGLEKKKKKKKKGRRWRRGIYG